MKLQDSWILAFLLAVAVFSAINAVTFSVCNRSVRSYVDSVGKYIHAL
jgi:hypothetical protein